jgi:hypothetical protein
MVFGFCSITPGLTSNLVLIAISRLHSDSFTLVELYTSLPMHF